MSRTYTKKEIAYNLECSVRTVEDDASFLGIKTTKGDRNTNLYSQRDFNLITQMREHCKNNANSRESFVPNKEVEIIKDEPRITKLTERKTAIDRYQQSLNFGLAQDPLFDLEVLQRISDNHWLLPAKRLAPLMGISAKYLNQHNQFYYCGFVANKETYVGTKVLWKVSANNS